jgi:hypothetical protein
MDASRKGWQRPRRPWDAMRREEADGAIKSCFLLLGSFLDKF